MTQPPQDRPDYPWGPSDADRGERAATPAPSSGSARGPAGPDPREQQQPSGPYTGTPHRADGPPPSGRAPYTGTPVSSMPPLGPPSGAGYAGDPPQQRDGEAQGAPVSTIVLLVLSGVVLLLTLASFVGIVFAAPVVLAIVALTRQSSDPASARRLTRIGWWIFAGLLVLGAVLIAVVIALAISLGAFATNVGPGGADPFGTTSTVLTGLTALRGAAW